MVGRGRKPEEGQPRVSRGKHSVIAEVDLVNHPGNVGYATMFPRLWQCWLGPVDGLEQEFYLSYSTRPNAVGPAWNAYESEVSSCAAEHKSCWFHAGEFSPAVTPQTRTYALASYLLGTDGHQLIAVGNGAPGDSWPRLTLGGRMSVMYQTGATWRRYFTGGVAVTNPSTSTSVVSLGEPMWTTAGIR